MALGASLKTYSGTVYMPTGIVFIIVTYNRVDISTNTISSLLDFIQPCDGVWIIDNGSVSCEQQRLDHHLSRYSESRYSLSASYIKSNNAGTFALELALSTLGNNLYPNATHFMVVGDDDYILRDLDLRLPDKLHPSDIYTWGFDYYDHRTCKRVSAIDFTHKVYTYDSQSCFEYWISMYRSFSNPYSLFINKLRSILPHYYANEKRLHYNEGSQ